MLHIFLEVGLKVAKATEQRWVPGITPGRMTLSIAYLSNEVVQRQWIVHVACCMCMKFVSCLQEPPSPLGDAKVEEAHLCYNLKSKEKEDIMNPLVAWFCLLGYPCKPTKEKAANWFMFCVLFAICTNWCLALTCIGLYRPNISLYRLNIDLIAACAGLICQHVKAFAFVEIIRCPLQPKLELKLQLSLRLWCWRWTLMAPLFQ